MPVYKDLAATVKRNDLAATIVSNVLAKTETNIYFLNHCDNDFSLGGIFAEMPCDGVLLVRELTTEYQSRWLTG